MRPRKDAAREDDLIQIWAPTETKAMLRRDANLRGEKLSEFVLSSALRQAEETILDQRIFFLDDDAHQKFLDLLDSPTKPSEELHARMANRLVWEH
ncbi:DUF1778 domain-containing protein [Mesorhizobium australafricanum]|uniref:DUF1778 domain-containing protein n=1 Tax=Mesorhizobium australafricanum TaxID=3072311 RepID=A0ABU4WY09_9HYPH|nr:DUF1778 domain-containing protein [Mesorhizobium sp. VK3E]MDX8440951.1 DUF1778 domain-containing protein [Mesorhizobium sp. VK3E]